VARGNTDARPTPRRGEIVVFWSWAGFIAIGLVVMIAVAWGQM
jgi:hypothetical protein